MSVKLIPFLAYKFILLFVYETIRFKSGGLCALHLHNFFHHNYPVQSNELSYPRVSTSSGALIRFYTTPSHPCLIYCIYIFACFFFGKRTMLLQPFCNSCSHSLFLLSPQIDDPAPLRQRQNSRPNPLILRPPHTQTHTYLHT